MKELTVSEIQEVSGGTIGESATGFAMAMGIGGAAFGSKLAGITVAAAFAMSPLATFAMLGIAFYSGYKLLGK